MTNPEFQEILRQNAVPNPERYRLATQEEIEASRLKPTYVWLNIDKLQDDPVSSQLQKKSGGTRVVILDSYDNERLLVCIPGTVCRQMILVPKSCLEKFDA